MHNNWVLVRDKDKELSHFQDLYFIFSEYYEFYSQHNENELNRLAVHFGLKAYVLHVVLEAYRMFVKYTKLTIKHKLNLQEKKIHLINGRDLTEFIKISKPVFNS